MIKHNHKVRMYKKLYDNERQRRQKIRDARKAHDLFYEVFCDLAAEMEAIPVRVSLEDYNKIWLSNIADFIEFLYEREVEKINEKTTEH